MPLRSAASSSLLSWQSLGLVHEEGHPAGRCSLAPALDFSEYVSLSRARWELLLHLCRTPKSGEAQAGVLPPSIKAAKDPTHAKPWQAKAWQA